MGSDSAKSSSKLLVNLKTAKALELTAYLSELTRSSASPASVHARCCECSGLKVALSRHLRRRSETVSYLGYCGPAQEVQNTAAVATKERLAWWRRFLEFAGCPSITRD